MSLVPTPYILYVVSHTSHSCLNGPELRDHWITLGHNHLRTTGVDHVKTETPLQSTGLELEVQILLNSTV